MRRIRYGVTTVDEDDGDRNSFIRLYICVNTRKMTRDIDAYLKTKEVADDQILIPFHKKYECNYCHNAVELIKQNYVHIEYPVENERAFYHQECFNKELIDQLNSTVAPQTQNA